MAPAGARPSSEPIEASAQRGSSAITAEVELVRSEKQPELRLRPLPVTPARGPVEIDGSMGEGGGQVLRTSLTLAVLTGRALRLENIRARRPKPGLMAQHLKAVEAAAAISGARVEGAKLGSGALLFEPQEIRPGAYSFDIGTAGSTSLVLQTILLPLAFAPEASTVVVTGGTHVPWSPSFHYLDRQWVPYLRQIGFDPHLELEQAGFYPRGGGRVKATVSPSSRRAPLRLLDRGALLRIRGISGVGKLDRAIAERQARRATETLAVACKEIAIDVVEVPAASPGTFLLLLAECEHSQACYCALGARGKRAERVADEAAEGILAFLAGDGAVDPWLADQLVLPLSITSGNSELRTARVTGHLLTNAQVVKLFLPVRIEIAGETGEPGTIRIAGLVSSAESESARKASFP
ncbi:MAG: RNA 3'-terminal phosphate cyclase [Acidobacteriota bacterium]|nr:RNA 3'-terminal phosphate cyclase [Acidobacteriota bacterium]